ncbi:hypothetical protein [Olleya sp. HaHaR_3_96]|uniref:hypothetical protein n=1 Tax=Olleya sp. HaHaR_3_96 TaxID=2745560 RepID=UPI001C4EADCD|nr:hypothetical protein [Olleya sp. HaHaR_3_96]QXP58225.1 hypothetical protein H0I26_09840 [Olleya sp. HaHaR_3_96]
MNHTKLLLINSLLFLIIFSCKKEKKVKENLSSISEIENLKQKVNDIDLQNSKFYLLSKDTGNQYLLKKLYFESDMESFNFKENIMFDKTGAAIMEPLEYIVLNKEFNNDKILVKVQNKWTNEKSTFYFRYDSKKNLVYQLENDKIIKVLIDSLSLKSIKNIYVPPCQEFQTDEYEIKDCLEEYVKYEEKNRVLKNDFNWYPRLDCSKYFNEEFCMELDAISNKK